MDDFNRLRAEIKADFELTWGLIADHGKRLDERIDKLEAHGADLRSSFTECEATVAVLETRLRSTGKRFDQYVGSLPDFRSSLQESNRISVGRIRLMSERFDAMIGAVDGRFLQLEG